MEDGLVGGWSRQWWLGVKPPTPPKFTGVLGVMQGAGLTW